MKIAIIGGGEGMLVLPDALQEWCKNVVCFYSDRHSNEIINGVNLSDALEANEVENYLVHDDLEFRNLLVGKNFDLVLGLGPAWIFHKDTLSLAKQWVNINVIPAPKFLGGAHLSWQILNNVFDSSVVYQQIDMNIDRGPILAKFDFEYTHKETKSPYLMLKRNIFELVRSLKIWMNSVGEHKITLDYSQSEYWPRLLSSIHGWIDWNWSSLELIQFIQAFGSPYGGARCLFADSEVILLEAEVIEKRTIHPFASGIILRCEGDDYLVIASRDGIMRIKCLGISEIKKSTMLGQRLFTPESKLKEARMKNVSARELN